jgi:hypothetical protein
MVLFGASACSGERASHAPDSGERNTSMIEERADGEVDAVADSATLAGLLDQWRQDADPGPFVEAFIALRNAPVADLRMSGLTEAQFRRLSSDVRAERQETLLARSRGWRVIAGEVLQEASEAVREGRPDHAARAYAAVQRSIEANDDPEANDLTRLTADAVRRMADRFAAEHPEVAAEQDGA